MPKPDERWHYQRPELKKQAEYTLGQLAGDIVRHVGVYLYCALGPILVLAVLYWIFVHLFADTFIHERWMQPLILLLAMFFSGVFGRMPTEIFIRSMGLFIAAILGFATYTALCWWDIHQGGTVFSFKVLPEPLRLDTVPYVYALPAVGIGGMFCYKWFTLK